MSEREMPKFMKDYLEELLNYPNGDDAWPGMQKLANEYRKEKEDLDRRQGAFQQSSPTQSKLYNNQKKWLEQELRKAMEKSKSPERQLR